MKPRNPLPGSSVVGTMVEQEEERLTSGNEQGNGAKYLKWLNYLNYHVLNHLLLFTRLSLLDSVSLTINREMYNSAFILNLK